MLGPTYDRFRHQDTNINPNNQKKGQVCPPVPPPQETKDIEPESKIEQNGDADSEAPPPKRICIEPISDSSQIDNKDEQVAPLLVAHEELKEKESQVSDFKIQKQQDGDLEDNFVVKNDCSKVVPNVSHSLMQQVCSMLLLYNLLNYFYYLFIFLLKNMI